MRKERERLGLQPEQILHTCDKNKSISESDIEIRPVIMSFAQRMEMKLRKNDYKGGWHNELTTHLQRRLLEEVIELFNAVGREDKYNEAADVANFAMMIADVLPEIPKV